MKQAIVTALLLLITLLAAPSMAQDEDAKQSLPKAEEQRLNLKIIGNGRMLTGALAGFRIYVAPDGTEAEV